MANPFALISTKGIDDKISGRVFIGCNGTYTVRIAIGVTTGILIRCGGCRSLLPIFKGKYGAH